MECNVMGVPIAIRELVDAADRVTKATQKQVKLHHPDDSELAFLYGTIITDGNDGQSQLVLSLQRSIIVLVIDVI
jgi:proline racemase